MTLESDERKVLVIRNGPDNDGYSVLGAEDEWGGDFDGENSSCLEELLGRRRPELIVLDLEIPIRHGVELLRTVTTACPEAEVMTRVDSRSLEPRFFSVRSSPSGLSLEPVAEEDLGELPALAFG